MRNRPLWLSGSNSSFVWPMLREWLVGSWDSADLSREAAPMLPSQQRRDLSVAGLCSHWASPSVLCGVGRRCPNTDIISVLLPYLLVKVTSTLLLSLVEDVR